MRWAAWCDKDGAAVESAEEGNGGLEVPSILAQEITGIVKRWDP